MARHCDLLPSYSLLFITQHIHQIFLVSEVAFQERIALRPTNLQQLVYHKEWQVRINRKPGRSPPKPD